MGHIGHMQNEWVIGRPAFGLENAGDRRGIKTIGTQAIDRLGGKGDQMAIGQHSGSACNG